MSEDDDDLFGSRTRARNADPWTSKAAAARIAPTLNRKQSKVLAVHRAHKHGLTNWELETLCGSHNSTWRTRVSELVALGLIVNSGRTKRILDSDDPRSERVIWICAEYADPYLFTPMPERPPQPPPPSNARYDAAGRLTHKCAVCGANAPFGCKVALRDDWLGTWYCEAHRP